jgi:hypothetical protein
MADEEDDKPEPTDHDRGFNYPPNFMDPELPSGVFSPSQFDTYRKCPKRYEYRHIYKIISPPGVAMIKGTAVHKGAEVTHRKMIETGQPLALVEAIQAVSDSFDEKRPDIENWEDKNPDHVKDSALNAFRVYYNEAVPIINPVKAEHTFAVKIGTVPVRGVIDLVDRVKEDAVIDGVIPTTEVVSDLKTASARWPEQRVRQSAQLTFYAFVEKTFRVRYDFILDQKSGIKYDQNKSMRTQHDFKLLIEDLEAVVDGIKRGYFPRSDGTNWWCTPKFCGYYERCRGPK